MIHLSSDSKTGLDDLLLQYPGEGKIPAAHIGIATSDQILYFKCSGDRVFSESNQGPVDAETRELLIWRSN